LILDESRENDAHYEVEGISFLMSNPTVGSVQKNASIVAIDYAEDDHGKGLRLSLKNSSTANASN
jgi:hypothetical protein